MFKITFPKFTHTKPKVSIYPIKYSNTRGDVVSGILEGVGEGVFSFIN
jgi:hypothetical protein